MRGPALVTIFGVAMTSVGTAALADVFCDGVEALLEQGTTHRTMALPSASATQVLCSTSLNLSGVKAVNCAWPFAYRSPRAAEAFEGMLQSLQECFGPDAIPQRDQGVNHPDFYDLRIFRFNRREVGVSIKDKGVLQQTYVFLRIQGPPQ